MAQNNKPRQPRKSWFDNQAERKGQKFLDGWANGQDRDFSSPDRKIRAIDNILRDIKDGLIDINKDMVETRLLNRDLLQSIIQVCHSRLEFFRRMSNAFAMLNNVSYCVQVQRQINEQTEGMDSQSKQLFVGKIDHNYQWLAYAPSLDGTYDPNTSKYVGGIPYARELAEACNHPAYQSQKRIADIFVKMYNEIEIVFSRISIGVCNNTLQPNDITSIMEVQSSMLNVIRNNNLQNRMSIPLDFNVLTGYDFTL